MADEKEKQEKGKRGRGSNSYQNKKLEGTNGKDKEGASDTAEQTSEGSGTTPATEESTNTNQQAGTGEESGQGEDTTASGGVDEGGEEGEGGEESTGSADNNEIITETGPTPELPTGNELNQLPDEQFKPYEEEAKVRDYAVSHGPGVDSIPEPQFVTPPGFGGGAASAKKPEGPIMSDIPSKDTGNKTGNASGGAGAGGGANQGSGTQQLNQNPVVNEMTPKEKRIAAENSVQAFWSLYEKLNDLGYHVAHVSDQKLMKAEMKDEIDLNKEIAVVTGGGKKVTVRGFFESYNITARKAFTVDEDLKKRLHEPMIREAMRLGLMMTDGQFIAKELGQDLLTKTVTLIGLKVQINNTFSLLVEDHKMRRQHELEEAERLKKENEKLREEKARRDLEDDEDEDEDEDDFEEGEGAAGNVEHDREWEKKMAEHIRDKANGGQGATNEVTTTTDTPVDQQ